MSKPHNAAAHLRIVKPDATKNSFPTNLENLINALGIRQSSPEQFIASLPFSRDDTTAGTENELQTVVIGGPNKVDLPQFIRSSNFYKNTVKYAASGDAPRRFLNALDTHLNENRDNIWENSWVRIPRQVLCSYADRIFSDDLRANKRHPGSARRNDAGRFFMIQGGEQFIRIPVSYLLKLALADAVGEPKTHPIVRKTAEEMMGHFLNDNTSPETYSFHPVTLKQHNGNGRAVADESLKRYLLTQLLTQYANTRFRLVENGQRACVYFAPHPLLRQKKLNNLVSDSFYRELFMSPCLSGWDRGEDKYQYMRLCHRVLSLSQLNAVVKLKEAGIITRNLVVLPNTSNTSLANNGTHISLGSKKLSRIVDAPGSGVSSADEKYVGDLVIKIMEHFLPLFVGTYSAAPYRFDYWDFHPEKMLGFLPHELDFTHLRMMWRRWRKKAAIRFLGRSMTPFGPEKMDRLISKVFQLKGDFLFDVRLMDYLVALLSTNESPALNGMPESDLNLKKDLADLGVFDESMPLYMLYRLRRRSQMGFSGFEGRYYSVFEDIRHDMGNAVNLQLLLTLLAQKYIFGKTITHGDIPDHPTLESERRQIFFGTAIGVPTFYVHQGTRNRMMMRILQRTRNTRLSRRYNGYIRVLNKEYRRALVAVIREDGADLMEHLGLWETITDLEMRIDEPETYSASGRLIRGILHQAGSGGPAMRLSGKEFNQAAENYYRTTLHQKTFREALGAFKDDIDKLDSWQTWREGYYNQALLGMLGGESGGGFLKRQEHDLLHESIGEADLRKMIQLMMLSIHREMDHEK
ncbi:MAG: hypothetical protein ACOZF0_17500 [Thermodesulfobacteriota bacterium]